MTCEKNHEETSSLELFTCPLCGAQRSMYTKGFHLVAFCNSCNADIRLSIREALKKKQEHLEWGAGEVGRFLAEKGIPISAATSIMTSGILRKIMQKAYEEGE